VIGEWRSDSDGLWSGRTISPIGLRECQPRERAIPRKELSCIAADLQIRSDSAQW
jgi:hypothetical protein